MTKNQFWDFYQKVSIIDKMLVGVFVIGVVFLSVGLFRGIVEDDQVQVEVFNNDTSALQKKIVVDVGGGVVSPGVYEFPDNSRIKDALIKAGGLSVNADRDYVQKNINLAQTIKDGQKIFIPSTNEKVSKVGYSEANSESGLININSATENELDTLTGIGEARALEIIKNRPYGNIEELVSKGVLSKNAVEKIKDKIVAY